MDWNVFFNYKDRMCDLKAKTKIHNKLFAKFLAKMQNMHYYCSPGQFNYFKICVANINGVKFGLSWLSELISQNLAFNVSAKTIEIDFVCIIGAGESHHKITSMLEVETFAITSHIFSLIHLISKVWIRWRKFHLNVH